MHANDALAAMDIFADNLFKGKTALVTGGGTGIGRAIALGFARYGANVVIASRNPENLAPTAAEIEALHVECLAVGTNIRDTEAVDALRAAASERFGAVDFLINNAGGQFPSLPSQISDGGWRAVVDTNLNGTWNMISRFAPDMAERRSGSIVNIVHVYSFDRGAPLFVHSGAARAGVVNLTQSLAWFLAQRGVTINAVAPGTVDTEGMLKHEAGPTEDLSGVNDFFSKFVAGAPSRRGGEPDEIAASVLYLCSPAARWINGTAVRVDGGETIGNWLDPFPPDSF